MGSKADALRERYERFSQGDLEGALDLWTDDFVWEGSNAPDLPGAGRHEGKEAAIEVLQRVVGAWDSFELTLDEVHEDDDTVFVLGHTDVSKDDRSSSIPVVHIWRFRGEGEVCRLQVLTDTLVGARVLGIVPPVDD
jgi:ketosteroid isomerase-like protein